MKPCAKGQPVAVLEIELCRCGHRLLACSFPMDYCEQLPEGCPPPRAEEIREEREVYRLVRSNPPSEWDFQSHRARYPAKSFRDECRARALSVNESAQNALMTMKLPTMKGKALLVCRVTLTPGAGCILQTGGNGGHYSWWVARGFEPIQNSEVLA